jgi:hypothetical protein
MKNISKERLEVITNLLVDLAITTAGVEKLMWHLEANGCTDDELIELGLEM